MLANVFAAPPGENADGRNPYQGTTLDVDGDIELLDAAAFEELQALADADIDIPAADCVDPQAWSVFHKRSSEHQTKLKEAAKKQKAATAKANDVLGKLKASASGNRKVAQGVAKGSDSCG